MRSAKPLCAIFALTTFLMRGGGVLAQDVGTNEIPSDVEIIDVTTRAARASDKAQIEERMQSNVASDGISAQSIRKSTDSDASEVVARIPAVTVKDNYIFIRGLGERYSSAVLNGSRLPSTDPNKRVIALDLFPSDFLDSLSVIKGYTPDLPGDFAGGLVDIRLREFPDKLTYSAGISTAATIGTTFGNFDTYDGGSADYVGFGAEHRALPDIIPRETLDPTTPGSTARMQALAGSFENSWDVDRGTAPPDFGVSFSVGGPVSTTGLGAALGATYSTSYLLRENELNVAFFNSDLGQRESFVYDRSTFKTRLGTILTSAYQPSLAHTFTLRALLNRNSTDEVLDGEGTSDNRRENTLSQVRLKYTEEQLLYGQLGGKHDFDWLQIDWRTALSQTTQDEPDTRYVGRDREVGVTTLPSLSAGPSNPSRTFSNLDELLTDTAIDFTVPFNTQLPYTRFWRGLPGSFKTGAAYTFRDRDFRFRRFGYRQVNTFGMDLTRPVEDLLIPSNIGSVDYPFEFSEQTRRFDRFAATQEIAAGFGMLELPLIRNQLRVIGGARLEYSYITVAGFDQTNQAISPIINDLNVLPGVNLVYTPLDNMNVRLGYSQTVSRPEFRELMPTEFPVPPGERTTIGNANLVSADITSYDGRWEWAYSEGNLVSFSLFYKELSGAIEQVALSYTSRAADSFRNAEADLYGTEFELMKDFRFLTPWLRSHRWSAPLGEVSERLRMVANVSYVQSEATIQPPSPADCTTDTPAEGCTETQTSATRAMVGQAPYTVNVSVEYTPEKLGTFRLLYNTIGRRIISAGVNQLPDIYDESRHQLDFVYATDVRPFGVPVKLKLGIENILDDAFTRTQTEVVRDYREGTRISLGLSYTY